ncbi:hypothetical protein SAMN05216370_4136 [Pseudomonas peli]|uniref:Uncharacterized protein n=1 Tax=Pseudomonas peli TaxID=592361 RepID=A0AB37ZDF0_9PSED|nr:hypothetical protein [Pseudomonas peli]NMZ71226.1 hypothetical protein [Pseudomonas peli]SCW86619.1 hypothetical protein SAMN05216370_4136 [Pseudomonas peli]
MIESPFVAHRGILVDGFYSAACFLRAFAMSMYEGDISPLDAGGLRNLDHHHMKVFQEMAAWFRLHGPNHPDFIDVCKAIKANRLASALEWKARLDELLASDPDSYEGGCRQHEDAVIFYRRWHEANVARRWID